jgi:signal peptidase II
MNRRLEISVSLAVVTIDQLSKALVRAAVPVDTSRSIVPGVLELTHVRNTGIAFDILNSVDFAFKPVVLAAVPAVALIGIAIYAAGTAHDRLAARIALALIIGGAIGNLIDRVTFGSVTDFVHVYWRSIDFWVFNVADSAISIGGIALLFNSLVQ